MSHRVEHEHGPPLRALSLSLSLSPPHSFHMSLTHLSLGPPRLLCSGQTVVPAIQAPGQPVCFFWVCVCENVCVCACVCVCVCVPVYSLSFLANPNNSPTVINIVWRSLRPAVSGPAAQGSGSDADEWPHTHTHTHTH